MYCFKLPSFKVTSYTGRGNSTCKGPEAGKHIVCSGDGKEDSLVGFR